MDGCGDKISEAVAAALLVAPEAMLQVEIEGCSDVTSVKPGRLSLAKTLSNTRPATILSHIVTSAARAWALGEIQGIPGPADAKLAAIECWGYIVARQAGVKPDLSALERFLAGAILLGNTPRSPLDAFRMISELARRATPRGLAARLFILILRKSRAKVAAVAQSGTTRVEGLQYGGPSEMLNRAKIYMALSRAAARRSWSRGWLRPPKRLVTLGDGVLLPGQSWGPVNRHAVLLDVSASMEGKMRVAVEAAAHALRYPARTRVLALFDYDIRREIVNPRPVVFASSEDLSPAGGTRLSKPLSRYMPCRADLVTVISDWGLIEDDLNSSLALMRKHLACGGSLVLVSVSPFVKPPRGPWITLDLMSKDY
ncbi:hypothetical protein [Aeropyrum pernix]|uniref:hypothetical protein n=1 Tax=Aeropyrum pernix TaxID=56636 RepID=UPI0011E556F4|nr:hypothetical protein [Aeropyrum pernix]